MASLITLTTDFGTGSRYVAAMKGVIYSINGSVTVVDITHSVPPQDIATGAITLAETTPFFPPSTIHVAVIDPGVGSVRRVIYVEIDDQRYVLPDNGLISCLASRHPPRMIRAITAPEFWRKEVSATFHGRDIMAPVAAHLSTGVAPEALGPPLEQLTLVDLLEANRVGQRIEGHVTEVDSFGNLITNISRDALAAAPTDESVRITCDEHQTHGIFRTYSDQPPMTFLAVIGSNDHLELAIVNDSAAMMLGVSVGTPVVVEW